MISQELEYLFAGTAYPGDEALANSPGAPGEPILSKLYGKDWRDLSVEDFAPAGGILEGVRALSSKGFLYFLPGLTHIAQTQPDHRSAVTSAMLSVFTHPETEARGLESKQEILSALSPRQRGFFVRFFIALQDLESTLRPEVLDSAIDNFKTGKVTPYRQPRAPESATPNHRSRSGAAQAQRSDSDFDPSASDAWAPERMPSPGSSQRSLSTMVIFILGLVFLFIGSMFLTSHGTGTVPAVRSDGSLLRGPDGQPLLQNDLADYCRENAVALVVMGFGVGFLCCWLARMTKLVYRRARGIRGTN